MTKEEALKAGILENKIISLCPIKKPGKMIKSPTHFGYFMFKGAFREYTLPRDMKTGYYKSILTKEELAFFNEAFQEDLSFTKKENNFWDTFSVRVTKTDRLMSKGLPFDMSDPYQNLSCKVLGALKLTAPSFEKRSDHPSFIWYLADENEEVVYEAKEAEKMEQIWTFFGAIKGSRKKMIDLLSVYYAEKNKSKEVDLLATKEFFISEIRRIIKNDPDFIYNCKNDNSYEIKALLADGVRSGAINKTGRNKYNIIGDNSQYDYIGLYKRVEFLKKENEDDYFRIMEQIEKYRKENKIK